MRRAFLLLTLTTLLAAAQSPAGRAKPFPLLAWAADNHLLVANDGLLARFDLNSDREELLDDTVIALALHPAGRPLAVASPGEVSLRSYPEFDWLAALPMHEHEAAAVPAGDTVQALAWSADGGTLAGGTASGHVLLWEIETTPPESGAPIRGELWADLELSPAAAVAQLSFSADAARLLSLYEDGRAVLWDLEQRAEVQRFSPVDLSRAESREASAEAGRMVLGPNGRRLLHSWLRGDQAEMSLLDDAGRVLWRRAGLGVGFTPDGSAVLALAPLFRVAALYRVEGAAALRVFEPPEGVERLLAVRLNPTGTRLAGVAQSRLGQTLVVWDVSTGRILRTRR